MQTCKKMKEEEEEHCVHVQVHELIHGLAESLEDIEKAPLPISPQVGVSRFLVLQALSPPSPSSPSASPFFGPFYKVLLVESRRRPLFTKCHDPSLSPSSSSSDYKTFSRLSLRFPPWLSRFEILFSFVSSRYGEGRGGKGGLGASFH